MDGIFGNFVVTEFNGSNVARMYFYSSRKNSKRKLLQNCETHLHLVNSLSGSMDGTNVDNESSYTCS